MGHQHHRRAPLGGEGGEQLDDGVAGAGVEAAGGLVGQQQAAGPDGGPGDGDALLLTAGEVVGVAVELLVQAHRAEGIDGQRAGGAGPDPVELEREHDVLDGGEARHEVEALEDEADVAAAQRGPAGGIEGRQVAPPDHHPARGRILEGAGQVQQ